MDAGPVQSRSATPFRVGWTLRLAYPLRSMLHRWRGMLGMMLGVGMALGMAMTLMATSAGSIEIYAADYRLSSADLYAVAEGGTLVAVLPSDTPGTIRDASQVLARVRGLPEVQAALGVLTWSLERGREGIRRDQRTELVLSMGVDGDPERIPGALVLQEGRWLRRMDEAVVGSRLAREKRLAVGGTLRLADRDFTIVGVGKLRGFGFSTDTMAYLDLRALRQRAGVGDLVNIIAVDTVDPASARRKMDGVASLAFFSPAELIVKVAEVSAAGVAFSTIFGTLALAIAGLFVSNMLGRAVAERRLEFATLRAIGIPTRTIFLAVSAEAMLITLAAVVLGVAISLFFGALINGIMSPAYGVESLYVVNGGTFVFIAALALGLGLLAGLFPARQAVRVEPVEVLREA